MRINIATTLLLFALLQAANADDDPSTGPPPTAPNRSAVVVAPSTNDGNPAHFSADSHWEVAGYNDDEIIYTVSITSKDARILRCRTDLEGRYRENGQLIAITDQQTSTVFPDQSVRVGNWIGLDKDSGATFTVKCRAI